MMGDAEGSLDLEPLTAHDAEVTHCAHRRGDPVEPEIGSGAWGERYAEGILVSFLYCSVIQQLEVQSH